MQKIWHKVNISMRIVLMLLAVSLFLPTFSHTALATDEVVETGDAIGDTLCKIVNKMTGKIGNQIANLAVIFLAIGVFQGKTNWGQAVAVGVGIGSIFGASQIVNFLAGTPIDCGTDISGQVPDNDCSIPGEECAN